jgi:hypothetical protein
VRAPSQHPRRQDEFNALQACKRIRVQSVETSVLRTIRRLNTPLRGQFRPPDLHPQTQNLSILLGETIDPAISGSLGIDLLHLIYSDELLASIDW